MDFKEIWQKGSRNPFRGTLLSLDPGHTTGYAFWLVEDDNAGIFKSGQIRTWLNDDLNHSEFNSLLDLHRPTTVVMESYQVYDWKKDEHSFSQVPTLQVIGCIKTLCRIAVTPYYSQTAQVAKQFVTDDKLEKWGMWKKGERHARDAIRHGCYWLLFGGKS